MEDDFPLKKRGGDFQVSFPSDMAVGSPESFLESFGIRTTPEAIPEPSAEVQRDGKVTFDINLCCCFCLA